MRMTDQRMYRFEGQDWGVLVSAFFAKIGLGADESSSCRVDVAVVIVIAILGCGCGSKRRSDDVDYHRV
jgi:hypothetical protein